MSRNSVRREGARAKILASVVRAEAVRARADRNRVRPEPEPPDSGPSRVARKIARTRRNLRGARLDKRGSKLSGKVPFTIEYLDEVQNFVVEFSHAIGVRDRTEPTMLEAAQIRHAAFTLLFQTWDKIRHVVQYVCEDAEEAERIAPTLFIRAQPAKHASGKDPVTPTTPAAIAPGFDAQGKPVVVVSHANAPLHSLASDTNGAELLGGSPFAH